MTKNAARVSVVIPVFDSSTSLVSLHARLRAALGSSEFNFVETIYVDDCSRNPDTWKTLETIAAGDPTARVIRLARNVGQQRATLRGLGVAQGDLIVTMDDDLQHPPEEALRLLLHLMNHPETEAVVASYLNRKQHSLPRNLASAAFHRLCDRRPGSSGAFVTTGFRALRRDIAGRLAGSDHPDARIAHLLFDLTPRIQNVGVLHARSENPRSRYSLTSLLRESWRAVRSRARIRSALGARAEPVEPFKDSLNLPL